MDRYDTFNVFVPKRDKQQVRDKSHYNEKIDRTPGRSAGITRDWGDASVSVQDAVIDALIAACKAHHLSKHDTAVILAIARNESGFNPDAANKEWSASGTGQFMDDTGPGYGVTAETRFDVKTNAEGMVRAYVASKKAAEKWQHNAAGAQKDKWIYKYYHDWRGKGRSFEEFDKPDGVRQWISPIEGAIGPSFDGSGQSPVPSRPRQPTPGASPAAPYQVPSTTSPAKASTYPYPTERPNVFGPTDPFTWSQNVSPIGPSWMNDNALLRSLPAWVNMPASYPGEVHQPGSGTPAYPTQDPLALLRRNQFFEPMPLDDPFVTGAAEQEGQIDPRIKNLLAPWLGVYR
jgi:hypothetical protein